MKTLLLIMLVTVSLCRHIHTADIAFPKSHPKFCQLHLTVPENPLLKSPRSLSGKKQNSHKKYSFKQKLRPEQQHKLNLQILNAAPHGTGLAHYVKQGACINAHDEEGNTPLMLLIASNDTNVTDAHIAKNIPFFVEKQANFDAQNLVGDSALIIAASRNYLRTVQALVDANAALHLQDGIGKTAAMWAVAIKNPTMLQILLSKSEPQKITTLKDTCGKTLLILAKNSGNDEIVKLIMNRLKL